MMRNPRGDTGLIIGDRDPYLRNALDQRFEHGVQSGVGDTDSGLFQQLQLRRPRYDNGIVRNRSDLLRIDLIAYGKYELQIPILRHSGYDSAEDIHLAVQNRPHRSVDKRLSR